MTVSSETSRWSYTGDGTTVIFAYDNKIFVDADLAVYVDGVLKTLTTDYTVSGAGTASGNVTFVTAPASGTSVVIIRDLDDDQDTDIPAGGAFPASSVEDALDRRTIVSQQLSEIISRAPKYAAGTTSSVSIAAPVAGKLLQYNGDGTALQNTSISELSSANQLLLTNNQLPLSYPTIAAVQADATFLADYIGSWVYVDEYATGKGHINAWYLIVAKNTGTHDGFEYISDDGTATGSVFQLKLRVTECNIMYGGAVPYETGAAAQAGTDSTTAITNVNTYAKANNKNVIFPDGHYKYSPSAEIAIQTDWVGDSTGDTYLQCDTATYTGIFFQQENSSHIRNISFSAYGGSQAGTGIYQADSSDTAFVGHQRLTRVNVLNFDKNIDVGNTFMNTYDQVRSEGANEGFYCVPNSGGGNGYVTTHLHLNCYYHNNDRNVYYLSPVNSHNVTFIGGSIENATGATEQSHFENIVILKMMQMYTEGATSIPWAQVASVSYFSLDGLYNTASGGLVLSDSSMEVSLKNVTSAVSTGTFTASGSTNKITMENVAFPSSGNTLGTHEYKLINATIDGTVYDDYSSNTQYSGGLSPIYPQTAVVTSASATDVYRFLTIPGGAVRNAYISGVFSITAIDTSAGTNYANYVFSIASAANGTGSASLVALATNQQIATGGTDPGTSTSPFSLANDGGSGAVKLQFTRNAAVASVTLNIHFNGVVVG